MQGNGSVVRNGGRASRLKACSEADLLGVDSGRLSQSPVGRQLALKAAQDSRDGYQRNPMPGNGHAGSKAGSHLSLNSRMSPDHSYRPPTKVSWYFKIKGHISYMKYYFEFYDFASIFFFWY